MVKPKVKSAYIEIPSSKRYSIGYGPVTLWVSGDAGWFEIIPSPVYAAMYCEIQEAITLYYEIMMAYEQQDPATKKKKKSKKDRSLPAPTLDQVFLQVHLSTYLIYASTHPAATPMTLRVSLSVPLAERALIVFLVCDKCGRRYLSPRS